MTLKKTDLVNCPQWTSPVYLLQVDRICHVSPACSYWPTNYWNLGVLNRAAIRIRLDSLQKNSLFQWEWGSRGTILVSVQFSSVAQSCLTLCDPMNRSTPGLLVHHQLPEFTQTHVHRVGDAIQPSHPLSSPSPPAPNPSHSGLKETTGWDFPGSAVVVGWLPWRLRLCVSTWATWVQFLVKELRSHMPRGATKKKKKD